MKVKQVFFYSSLFVLLSLKAQIPNNTWRDHLAYNRGRIIAITPEKVFCSMKSGGMLSYIKSTGEVEKLSKVTGLSDINITAIAYSKEADILVIGYKNGNIDLLTRTGLVNMPDIKHKRISGFKSINKITINKTSAFLACNFGIVEIDLKKIEIRDSYFFGTTGTPIIVNDVAILNNILYAATELGIYKADLNAPNLVDYSYWKPIVEIPQNNGEYKIIESFNNEIIATYKDASSKSDVIIRLSENNIWEYWNPVSDSIIYEITYYNNQLSVVTQLETQFYNTNLQLINSLEIITGRYAVTDTDGLIYAAADYRGFLLYRNGANEVNLNVINPRFNTMGFIATKQDQVWVGSGGPFNKYYQGAAYKFSDERWTSLSAGYTDGFQDIGNIYKFAFHPTIDDYVYASSYLKCLLEIHDNKVVARHDRNSVPLFNEALNPIVGVRIMGLDCNTNGDLWTIMDETVQPVFVLREGKEWEQVKLSSSIFKNASQWRSLLVTKTNQIWILNDRMGVVVLQEQSDGSILEKYFKIQNQDGDLLSIAYSMTEDNDGNIWIGTNKGPIVYSSNNNIFEDDNISGSQVKIPRNDGTNSADYLLDYEVINDIAVDGGNRKWLATGTSGIFLVSSDGLKTLQQFNIDNSPMISNNVISVGVQKKTGEVFISTNEGLVGYMGRSTEGLEDFTDVYVYPNPIRPEYEGDITISGLIDDANVKITDISGNLVYETTSLGGQAIWDGKNFDGRKVQTGIYLVFMTNADGSKTHITKLAFIH